MGFTVTTSLFGLPSFSWYISIRGSYTIEKNAPTAGSYRITYTIYYSASPGTEAKIKEVQFVCLDQLPSPANIYATIYADIKSSLGAVQTVDD